MNTIVVVVNFVRVDHTEEDIKKFKYNLFILTLSRSRTLFASVRHSVQQRLVRAVCTLVKTS